MIGLGFGAQVGAQATATAAMAPSSARELAFRTHDDYTMSGRLTVPGSNGRHAVVIYVQSAEGMTMDMKRRDGRGGTFDYMNLYATKLPAMNVAFFSYEGRGVRRGDRPPRFEAIDTTVYNTSSLDNKVRDAMAAVRLMRQQLDVDPARVYLMGASEGTLLAVETASRIPREVAGLILYGALSTNMRETFRYIVTDGAYLGYRGFFDTDKDGRISKGEFEADPMKIRERVFRNADFGVFDRDGNGFFDLDEVRPLSKPLTDAIDQDNFTMLDNWARTSAGTATPAGWFKDHFAHSPMWTFLSTLDIPVGFFHGELDTATPVAGVRALEARVRSAGKTRMEFHYFRELDHTLGIGGYFTKGTLPAGHVAIFDFIGRMARESPQGDGPHSGTTSSGLYYEVFGVGEPVVLVHAFSVDRREWDPQIAAFRDRFRVIRYDLRGHGRSAVATEPFTAYDDLRSVLDTLGVERATLVGVSAGSELAINFAIVYPERVARLALGAPGVGGYTTPMLPWMGPVFEAAGAGDAERAARLWAATPIMTLRNNVGASDTLRSLVMSNSRLWTSRRLERPLTPAAVNRLAEIRATTVIVLGDQDLPHIKDVAALLAKGIAGAKIVSVPGAGHMVNMDAPQQFNAALAALLARPDTGKPPGGR